MKNDFVHIDESRLDEEWLRQPDLYFKYASQLADAKQRLDQAKAELDLVEAECNKDIRERPEHYGVDRSRNTGAPTEDAVKKAVVIHDDYQAAVMDIVKHKHEVEVLAAAVNALDHKKRALENLVSLHGQSYFAAPRATGAPPADTPPGVKKKRKKEKK